MGVIAMMVQKEVMPVVRDTQGLFLQGSVNCGSVVWGMLQRKILYGYITLSVYVFIGLMYTFSNWVYAKDLKCLPFTGIQQFYVLKQQLAIIALNIYLRTGHDVTKNKPK